MQTVGLITYHTQHLKTEQVLHKLLMKPYLYRMYALPFSARKPREVVLQHRPAQHHAVHSQDLAHKFKIPYHHCESDLDITPGCDVYLILGAGLLSEACLADKRVINCHAGIIPTCRGLDAFKWAIYLDRPLGVTLHYIDKGVDAGETICVIPTPVYKNDSLDSLARRHYDSEIHLLAEFDRFLERPNQQFEDYPVHAPTMRMPRSKEREMLARFANYLDRYKHLQFDSCKQSNHP